jgi:hypothetical protein
MIGSEVSWKIEGHLGELTCGPLRASIGCGADGTFFIPSQWHSHAISDVDVFASELPDRGATPPQLAELYVRGSDLVAEFSHSGLNRIAPHLYWRATFEQGLSAAKIELVLSVRTELLDSGPTWSVSSYVMNSALFHSSSLRESAFDDISIRGLTFQHSESDEHLFVFRRHDGAFSYAEMVHPSDFVAAEATPDRNQPLFVKSTLFPERLEKGVIRRARICGWFMPAENDLETAVELAKRFVDEPLPLTA